MRRAFPYAAVSGFEHLVPAMGNHPKDRHVLAAAVRSGAQAVVTANVKDFPAAALAPHGVEAIHPDKFLQDLLDLDPELVLSCLREQQQACRNPEITLSQLLTALGRTVPGFAAQAIRLLYPPTGPLPLEAVADEAALEAFFPGGAEPDRATPVGAAYLWWSALLRLDEPGMAEALRTLSAVADDWGDYRQIADDLSGWSLAQRPLTCPEAPNTIAYVKFLPDTGHSMRAFADAPLYDVMFLTMVRCEDGFWRAWRLSRNWVPPIGLIFPGSPSDENPRLGS